MKWQRLGWVVVCLGLVAGCDRQDTQAEDNPTLTDPDRDTKPRPTEVALDGTSQDDSARSEALEVMTMPRTRNSSVERDPTAASGMPSMELRKPTEAQKQRQMNQFRREQRARAKEGQPEDPVVKEIGNKNRKPKATEETADREADETPKKPKDRKTGPPEPKSGVTRNEEQASPGYTMVTVLKSCKALLLDNEGKTIRAWKQEGDRSWESCRLLPDGDVYVVGVAKTDDHSHHDHDHGDHAGHAHAHSKGIPDEARYLARYDWSGELKWRKPLTVHNTIDVLADGRVAALTYGYKDGEGGTKIRDDVVTLLSPDGEVQQSVSIHEIMKAAEVPVTQPEAKRGRDFVDLYHANSIQFGTKPAADNADDLQRDTCVLVALQNQDRVVVIDTATSQLVWEWGSGVLKNPHDARFLENGNVMVFDNGQRMRGSRVLEVNPADGEITWRFGKQQRNFYTGSRGANQRLSNGNTLVTVSAAGEVLETTPEGEIVWRYLVPDMETRKKRAEITVARRYPPELVDKLLSTFGTAPN